MRTWLTRTRDAVRTRLWPLPTMAVLVALLAGLGVPELDAAYDARMGDGVRDWLFGGDADAARTLLDAIASSLITVTSLTFSLTVVTLQLASSQFSPRLLRTFTGDQFVQGTLALFLATFTYALTVLRAVRSAGDEGGSEFVPRAAVTLAFVLAVASVVALVLFLAHLTAQIRVETMLRNVHQDATRTMEAVLAERDDTDSSPDGGTPASPPSDALVLRSADDGFLTWIDQDALLDVVVAADAAVSLDVAPGAFVVAGTPAGALWSTTGAHWDRETSERVSHEVLCCVHTSFERTSTQDVGLGLRQLVDVANKALSPGINDPTTAIHALGHVSAFLCDLTDRDLGPCTLPDPDGRVRVVLHRPDFATYVDAGLSQPRRYGADDPQVVERLFQVLLDLGYRARTNEHRHVVAAQLDRLRATVVAQDFDATERAGLAALGAQVETILRAPA